MTSEEFKKTYHAKMHQMQTAIAALMGHNQAKECDPKHLRVGINSALQSNGAVAKLLIEKGIITEDELHRELLAFLDADIERYMQELERILGVRPTLL